MDGKKKMDKCAAEKVAFKKRLYIVLSLMTPRRRPENRYGAKKCAKPKKNTEVDLS